MADLLQSSEKRKALWLKKASAAFPLMLSLGGGSAALASAIASDKQIKQAPEALRNFSLPLQPAEIALNCYQKTARLKHANFLTSLKSKWDTLSPQAKADTVTLLGSMGVGAGVNAVTGALGAEPGYRREAAMRDAFSGSLGGLATFATLKGTQKLFDDAGTDPLRGALYGLGGSALSKAIYGMQWPLERAVFGRPSWDVMPEDLHALKKEIAEDPEEEKKKKLAADASAVAVLSALGLAEPTDAR